MSEPRFGTAGLADSYPVKRFDPAAIAPGSDLNGRPQGIRRVMVNGRWAVEDGAYVPGSLHGQFLLK